jgi:hypothetical protein
MDLAIRSLDHPCEERRWRQVPVLNTTRVGTTLPRAAVLARVRGVRVSGAAVARSGPVAKAGGGLLVPNFRSHWRPNYSGQRRTRHPARRPPARQPSEPQEPMASGHGQEKVVVGRRRVPPYSMGPWRVAVAERSRRLDVSVPSTNLANYPVARTSGDGCYPRRAGSGWLAANSQLRCTGRIREFSTSPARDSFVSVILRTSPCLDRCRRDSPRPS